jgi:hypothetical protein
VGDGGSGPPRFSDWGSGGSVEGLMQNDKRGGEEGEGGERRERENRTPRF